MFKLKQSKILSNITETQTNICSFFSFIFNYCGLLKILREFPCLEVNKKLFVANLFANENNSGLSTVEYF